MTIATAFSGAEDYAVRMARLQAIYDFWFGQGAFVAAGNLGAVRANFNTLLLTGSIDNREAFANWLSDVNSLNDYDQWVADLAFGSAQDGALWRASLASSVYDANTGGSLADPGDGVGRIEDQSGNGINLTQASSSLRPVFGQRPATGARNRLTDTEYLAATSWTRDGVTATDEGDGVWMIAETATTGGHRLLPVSGVSLPNSTRSIEVKPAGRDRVYLRDNALVGCLFLLDGAGSVVSGSGGTITALDDGWYRVTHSRDVSAAAERLLLQLADDEGNASYVGDGSSGVLVRRPQLEAGLAATNYQRVAANDLDVTEDGVQTIPYADFDLVDDVLASGNLTVDGQAFVAGDGGCYITDLTLAAAPFSIGGANHNWTGAAPGILKAVTGDTGRVMDAIIREGDFTEAEIARLERLYIAQGGKGLLVPDGVELIANGGFDADITGWIPRGDTLVAYEAGKMRVTSPAGGYGTGYTQITCEIGGWYLLTLDGSYPGSAVSWRCLVDTTNSFPSPFTASTNSDVLSGTKEIVFKADSTTLYVGAQIASGTSGLAVDFDNISLQRLIPREDL